MANESQAKTSDERQLSEVKATITGVAKYDSNGGNIFNADARSKSPEDGVRSNAMEWEDDFKGTYGVGKLLAGAALIEPPYNLSQMEALCDRNNALRPCIDAMITNVDGTGWVIELRDDEKPQTKQSKKPNTDGSPPKTADTALPTPPGEKATQARQSVNGPEAKAEEPPVEGEDQTEEVEEEVDPKVVALTDFFREPWPGMSFTTLRKKLRRDLERTGNAYMEIIRNQAAEIVFARHVEAKTMRLITLDNGFWVEMKLKRRGADVSHTVHVRRRRYAQKINSVMTYFREFGAERQIDRDKGNWIEPENENTTDAKLGTEIIHFVVDKDVNTPYGVPRWISQTPSILGSRQAEEYNLAYFEAGGVPPAMITVLGGSLASDVRETIQTFMSSNPKTKNRAIVVEVSGGSGGSISDQQKVDVKVEKFGDAQAKDSMFETYDDKCEKRVRKAFRIPPLFVGLSADYNYASAYASYVVAEAQVFKPERDEFDEIISLKLVRDLAGDDKYVFRSLGLSVSDVKIQVDAVISAKDKGSISHEQFVEALNELLSLDLKVDPKAEEQAQLALEQSKAGIPHPMAQQHELTAKELANRRAEAEIAQIGKPPPLDPNKVPQRPLAKAEFLPSHNYVTALAADVADMVRKSDFGPAYRRVMADVGELKTDELILFKEAYAEQSLGNTVISSAAPEILVQALQVLADNPEPEEV